MTARAYATYISELADPRTRKRPVAASRRQPPPQPPREQTVGTAGLTTAAKHRAPSTPQQGTGPVIQGRRQPSAPAERGGTLRTSAADVDAAATGVPTDGRDAPGPMHADASPLQPPCMNDPSSPGAPEPRTAAEADADDATREPHVHDMDAPSAGGLLTVAACVVEAGQSRAGIGDDEAAEPAGDAPMLRGDRGKHADEGTEGRGVGPSRAGLAAPVEAAGTTAGRPGAREAAPPAADDAAALKSLQGIMSQAARAAKGRRRREQKRLVLSPPPQEGPLLDPDRPQAGSVAGTEEAGRAQLRMERVTSAHRDGASCADTPASRASPVPDELGQPPLPALDPQLSDTVSEDFDGASAGQDAAGGMTLMEVDAESFAAALKAAMAPWEDSEAQVCLS